jgi:4'-phosphopantetheinyl transferase
MLFEIGNLYGKARNLKSKNVNLQSKIKMPLFKTILLNSSTQILVWEITESYQELLDAVVLNESNSIRLNGMKSEMHQRAFLSVRKLFQVAGYTDFDLYYDEFGKPHLHHSSRKSQGNCYISITHSHQFSAIILSDVAVGIDVELQREKIIRIADKFVNEKELGQYKLLGNSEYIKKLTVIWGIKEAVFKIRNEKGISFKDHIFETEFNLLDQETKAQLRFENEIENFDVHFEEIDLESSQQKYVLVYALGA